jgi:hypothetical protein
VKALANRKHAPTAPHFGPLRSGIELRLHDGALRLSCRLSRFISLEMGRQPSSIAVNAAPSEFVTWA